MLCLSLDLKNVLIMCVCVGLCTYVCGDHWRPEVWDPSRDGASRGCQIPDVGPRSQSGLLQGQYAEPVFQPQGLVLMDSFNT